MLKVAYSFELSNIITNDTNLKIKRKDDKMKNNLRLKGITYSKEEINIENLYNIFAEVIIKDIKKGEQDEKIYDSSCAC